MPTPASFDYAVIRVAPRVEREEFINAGVILFCLERKFLGAKTVVDEDRLRRLWHEVDIGLVTGRLEAFERICRGEAEAGPIATLGIRERFHWLVAPRSTIVQVSAVHS